MAAVDPPSHSSAEEFRRQLRNELPRLLREDPDLRRALEEVLRDIFPSRAEVAELRALREDFNRFAQEAVRRFEAMDRRFADTQASLDRRFDAVISELRSQRLHLSRLSGRIGHGLEYL